MESSDWGSEVEEISGARPTMRERLMGEAFVVSAVDFTASFSPLGLGDS